MAVISRARERPSRSGIWISKRTTSIAIFRHSKSASSPFSASNSSACGTTLLKTLLRLFIAIRSSSTIRIFIVPRRFIFIRADSFDIFLFYHIYCHMTVTKHALSHPDIRQRDLISGERGKYSVLPVRKDRRVFYGDTQSFCPEGNLISLPFK